MTIYISAIALILIFEILLKPRKNDQRKYYFLVASFLVLFIISAFRDYSVGADTRIYSRVFNVINQIKFTSSRMEPGFLIYLKLLGKISTNPSIMIITSSLFNLVCVFVFIHRYSDEPTMSVLLYVLLRSFFASMNLMRSTMASSFVLLAYMTILEGQTKKRIIISILLTSVALTFHTTLIVAFFPLLIWLIIVKKGNVSLSIKKTIVFIILFSIIAFINYNFISRTIIKLFPQYTSYFSSKWSESNYFASLVNTLISFVFLLVGSFYYHDDRVHSNKELLALVLIGCAVVTSTLSMRMEFWGRIAGVFTLYTALLWVPCFLSRIESGYNRILIKTSIFFLALGYFVVVLIFRPGWDGVIPYLFR